MARPLALLFVSVLAACSAGGQVDQNTLGPAQVHQATTNTLTVVDDFSVFTEAYEPCCPPQNGCFAFLPSDKNVYPGTPETFSPNSDCPYNGTYEISDQPGQSLVTCAVSLTYHSTGYTFGLTNGGDTDCSLVTQTDGSATVHYDLVSRAPRRSHQLSYPKSSLRQVPNML